MVIFLQWYGSIGYGSVRPILKSIFHHRLSLYIYVNSAVSLALLFFTFHSLCTVHHVHHVQSLNLWVQSLIILHYTVNSVGFVFR